MKTNRPLSLTFASLFLILALLTVLILPLLFGARLLTGDGFPGAPAAGNPSGSTPPQRIPGAPNRILPAAGPMAGLGGAAWLGVALLCANILGGVAAVIAAVGLWRCKKWGLILALVVAVLGIVAALPGLVGGMRTLVASLPSLLRITLLTAVAVLALLPSSLDAYD